MKNVLASIGNTPLVKLKNVVPEGISDIYVKLEYLNPSGSIKDRMALSMIEDAEKKGLLKPGSTIVEPTSGNCGIALSMISAIKGYRMIAVMPEVVSEMTKKLIQAYGAEVVFTPMTDDYVKDSLIKAEELTKELNAFMPNQFANAANTAAYLALGKEIFSELDGKVDAFVAGVGSGGTLMGTAQYLRQVSSKVKIAAIEPAESAVMLGEPPGRHFIRGIGDGFIPELIDMKQIDQVIKIPSSDALEMAKQLASKEGLGVGMSSGANVLASIEMAKIIGPGHVIVTVLPDTSQRYIADYY